MTFRYQGRPYLGESLGRSIAAVGASGAIGTGVSGLYKEDCDQLALDLAVVRDLTLIGHYSQAAVYDETGAFVALRTTITDDQFANQLRGKPEHTAVGVYGGAPLAQIWPAVTDAEGNPVGSSREAVEIAEAIDRVLSQIASSPTFDAAPSGAPAITQNVIAPLAIGIIVVGAAAAIVGTAYVWRKFDPETQTNLAAVRASADAYRARVSVYQQTGKMPPAGPVEAATGKFIRDAASRSRSTAMWQGIAIGGGVAALAVGGVALARSQGARLGSELLARGVKL